jgi:hypothetical protein
VNEPDREWPLTADDVRHGARLVALRASELGEAVRRTQTARLMIGAAVLVAIAMSAAYMAGAMRRVRRPRRV